MPKRVYTGCRDCVKCMGTGVNVGARNLTRGLFAASSGGVTELGFALMPKCRVCGHQKSLHREGFSDKMDRLAAEHRAEKQGFQEIAEQQPPEAPRHKRVEQPKLTPRDEMSKDELEAKLESLQDALEAGMMNQSQYETMSEPFRKRLAVLRSIARDATFSPKQDRDFDAEGIENVLKIDSSPAKGQSREFYLAKGKQEIEDLRLLRDEGILDAREFVEQAKEVHSRYMKLANETE